MPRYKVNGRWVSRFVSPPNAEGLKKRIHVTCPEQLNTVAFLKRLEAAAIANHLAQKP